MLRYLVVIMTTLSIVFGSMSVVQASEREDVIKAFGRLSPSVGALYAQRSSGDITFLCSATAVDRHEGKTVILTASHCLQKGVSYLINFGDNRLRSLLAWKIPHYDVDSNKYPRVYNEPDTDMALFLMDGIDVPIVKMADDEKLKPGSKIVMLGYPLGVTKIGYEGTISGYFDRLGTPLYNYLMLQIFGAPGSSGSSVIDVESGKVIGILVQAKQSYVGLPVIFATPISYRKYLLPINPEKKTADD